MYFDRHEHTFHTFPTFQSSSNPQSTVHKVCRNSRQAS
jgi:hypothetical protein